MKHVVTTISIAALFVLAIVSKAVLASSDANWLPVGGGVNGVVNAIAIDKRSGNVYVGGSFTSAGGVAANNIAMWNGRVWSALGSGTSDAVSALAVDSNGNLYAGGDFTSAGGVTADGVAEWNGSTWSAVGLSSVSVTSLALGSNGKVYISGYPLCNPPLVCLSIEMTVWEWDGSTWSPLGNAEPLVSTEPLVSDSNGNLYTYGMYIPDGATIDGIAKWDGSMWSAVSPGLNQNYQMHSLTIDSDGNFYLGGHFSIISGDDNWNYRVSKWDGMAWTALGSTEFDLAINTVVKADNGNVYAAGTFTQSAGIIMPGQVRVVFNHIAKWNGTAWDTLGSGTDNTIYALAVDANGNVYAGGNFTTAGGKPIAYLAKWTGDANAKVKNDFDGDRKSDVLFLNASAGSTRYWSGAAKAQTVYPGAYNLGYSYAGSGDFDGDGKADLLFTKASNNGTLIWNDAVKTATSYPGTGTAGFNVAAICDVNGDGKDDIIWFNPANGKTQIWSGASKSAITYPGTQSAGYSVAACADFDGDGNADVFWHNSASGANQIWLSANKSTKSYPGTTADVTWVAFGAGDIDGDGKNDMVWYKASNNSTMVWMGGMKSAITYPGTGVGGFIPKAIGDYDGDGKADLLWAKDTTLATQLWPGLVKASATYPGKYPAGFAVQK